MEISKSHEKGLKIYMKTISDGLIKDLDFFVDYMSYTPVMVIMVDLDFNKIPKVLTKYDSYLEREYSDKVRTYLKMVDISAPHHIKFQVLNKPE